MAHLNRLRPKLRRLARGEEHGVQPLHGFWRRRHLIEDRGFKGRHGKLEDVRDPLLGARSIADHARFDGSFQSLRIAVRAHRKGRARELQETAQAHSCGCVWGWACAWTESGPNSWILPPWPISSCRCPPPYA